MAKLKTPIAILFWCNFMKFNVVPLLKDVEVMIHSHNFTYNLNGERTPFALFSSVFTIVIVLCSTGLFMLNAGDVTIDTIEASEVPTAMYQSGWQNCAEATTRVRKLLVCAIMQGQQPEVLWALGIVPMSYESYVSIVKTSYSMFTMIYSKA